MSVPARRRTPRQAQARGRQGGARRRLASLYDGSAAARGRGGRMNVWVEAARPRTLPASLAPVLVGTAAGAASHGINAGRFALVIVVALAIQVAVNYANDYFDGVRGVDTVQRAGPRRAVASGLV